MKNIALLAVLVSGFAGLAFAFSGSPVEPGLSPSGVHTNLLTTTQGNAIIGPSPSFQPALTYLPNQSGIYPATVSLRNNGINDLIIPQYPGQQFVQILLGNGDGTFTAGTPISTGNSTGPEEVATADINGDGCLDLAIAYHSTTQVGIWLGNCQGGFTQASGSPLTVASGPSAIAFGKLGAVTGSTNFSLVVGQGSSSTIDVFVGNGDGTFGSATTYTGGNGMRQGYLVDLNNDGNLDFVTLDRTTRALAVLFGTSTATFGAVVETNFPTSIGTEPGLAVQDLNGDGIPDVVVARSIGFLVYFGQQTGTNSWTPILAGTYPAPLATSGTVGVDGGTFPTGGTFTTVAIGDINGDGLPDVALTLNGQEAPNSTTVGIAVYYATGPGSFGQNPFIASMASQSGAAAGPQGVVLADFNRDGFLDVAATSANSGPPSIPAVSVFNSQPAVRTVPSYSGIQSVNIVGGALSSSGIDAGASSALLVAPMCQTKTYARSTGTSVTATTALDIPVAGNACNQLACTVDSNYYFSLTGCDAGAATTTDQILPAKTTIRPYTVDGETGWCVYPVATGECFNAQSN